MGHTSKNRGYYPLWKTRLITHYGAHGRGRVRDRDRASRQALYCDRDIYRDRDRDSDSDRDRDRASRQALYRGRDHDRDVPRMMERLERHSVSLRGQESVLFESAVFVPSLACLRVVYVRYGCADAWCAIWT